MPITPSQYIHARFDNRFEKNSIYIFHTLDWIELVTINNSIKFFQRKQFQEDITAAKSIHIPYKTCYLMISGKHHLRTLGVHLSIYRTLGQTQ